MATRTAADTNFSQYWLKYRAAAAYTKPADLAAWTAFEGTFSEVGMFEGGGPAFTSENGTTVPIDTGGTIVASRNMTLQGPIIQTTPTNFTEYNGAFNGKTATDFLYIPYCNETQLLNAYVIRNVYPVINFNVNNGDSFDQFMFTAEVTNACSLTSIVDYFVIPTS